MLLRQGKRVAWPSAAHSLLRKESQGVPNIVWIISFIRSTYTVRSYSRHHRESTRGGVSIELRKWIKRKQNEQSLCWSRGRHNVFNIVRKCPIKCWIFKTAILVDDIMFFVWYGLRNIYICIAIRGYNPKYYVRTNSSSRMGWDSGAGNPKKRSKFRGNYVLQYSIS